MREPRLCLEDRLILQLCANRPDYPGVLRTLHRRSVDWGVLIRRARRHRVAAVVLDRVLGLPLARVSGLPTRDRRALQGIGKKEIVSVLHDNAVFRRELAVMLRQLQAAGIQCILLKGLRLNFSQLRWMGDIDLLVPQDRLVEAIEALLGADGYHYRRMGREGPNEAASYAQHLPPPERRRVRSQASWNNEYQLFNPRNGVLVEVHHKLFQIRNPDGRFMENIDGVLRGTDLFWRQRRYDRELGCFTLSAPHSLLLCCLRNAVKDAPGNDTFRLSNLVDIDNLVAAGIPWPELTTDCLELGIAPQILFSLKLAGTLLGTAVPAPVLRSLRQACTPRQRHAVHIHRRCVNSLGCSSIPYSKLYRALGPWVFGGTPLERLRWLLLLPLWVPSRSQIAQFFGLRRNSPWVPLAYLANPLRWLYRIVRKLLDR